MSDRVMAAEERSRRDMAVAVARDVILRIGDAENPLKIKHGFGYISGILAEPIADMDGDLRDYADVIQRDCGVCQLGALMLSKARLYDDVPIERLVCSTNVSVRREAATDSLAGIFSMAQMDLLECAFETKNMSNGYAQFTSVIGAIAFGCGYDVPAARALAIMGNVIENDGEFVVTPLERYGSYSAADFDDDYCDDDDDDDFDDDDDDFDDDDCDEEDD